MDKNISTGDKYRPAMDITEQDKADAYFEEMVQHGMAWGHSREEAEEIERYNLGYWAGYYDNETRVRVERLFKCSHPVFGKAGNNPVTPKEALKAGMGSAKTSQSS